MRRLIADFGLRIERQIAGLSVCLFESAIRNPQSAIGEHADVAPTRDLGRSATDWILGCAMVYLVLFGAGKPLLQQPGMGAALLLAGCAVAVTLYVRLSRRDWSETAPDATEKARNGEAA